MADKELSREKIIIRTSLTGVFANILLAAFKAAVGLTSSSIAVILDAVNNLSDALSSVITIVGTKLALKAPDKKHPLGYGRIEYLTAMIVSALVLYAGITSLTESVKKIITPQKPDYSKVSLIIIAAAVLVKLILGRYVKAKGKKVSSSALIASGEDASFDAILSCSVLASAIFFTITKISLESYVGLIISLFIIKSGIEMIIETLNDILGKRTDAKLSKAIKKTVSQDPDVFGAYDLFLFNYGPEKNYGTIHVEISDQMTAAQIDAMERRIFNSVMAKHKIFLTGIGIYSRNSGNSESAKMYKAVSEKILAKDYVVQMHGFYADLQAKTITFDAVLTFDCNICEALEDIKNEVHKLFPDYTVNAQADVDISE